MCTYTARLLASCLLCLFCALPSHAEPPAAHPLDPLSAAEIETAVAVLKAEQNLSAGVFFPMLTLDEPEKAELSAFEAGNIPARRAAAVVLDPQAGATYEAVVDLTGRHVLSWKELSGLQSLVLSDDYEAASNIVRADPQWQAAMHKRGITDLDKVYLDGWAPGYSPDFAGSRLMRVLSFYQGDAVNAYGRPIEGVVALVNLSSGKVQQLLDTHMVPVPAGKGTDFFDPEAIGPPRAAPRPLVITQPEGPSFEIHGHEVRWQKWRFRFTLHPREGLVLHRVGYEDGDRVRSILHRASVAEMVVPYGDPHPSWNWRSAFDQGEYGLGRTASSLALGKDVPVNAVLLDAQFADDVGAPYSLPAALAIYEQDGGLLWKHYDSDTGKAVARRGRQLVIGYVATIGNYDYGLNWIFHQDGTLEVRVDLTGILLVKGVAPQSCEACRKESAEGVVAEVQGDQRYGTIVDKDVVAANHQHIFSFRLDFDIEGAANRVNEYNTHGLPPGPANPAGNAFVDVPTPLRTEQEARRLLSPEHHRRWKVYNAAVTNELGHFAAYALDPAGNAIPYASKDAALHKRAGYVNRHLWVTRYKRGEEHAAGDYPRQRAADEGLPQWSGDESLEDQDVVLWYTLGVTHVPRAEEWPVMSAAHTGFKIVPAGFFVRNPALDVPDTP